MGYNADVLKAIAQDQGFNPVMLIRRWDDLFPALNAGDCRMISATLGQTEERKKNYAMSAAYGITTNGIFWSDPKLKINSPDDLHSLKIAVQQDTVADEYVTEHGYHVTRYPTTYLALKAWISGEAQVVVGDAEVFIYYLRQDPSFKYKHISLGLEDDQSGIRFLMKKNDTELLMKINKGIKNITANGTLAKLQQKWLGTVQTLPVDEPGGTSAAASSASAAE